MTHHYFALLTLLLTSCFQGSRENIIQTKTLDQLNNIVENFELDDSSDNDTIKFEQRKFCFFSSNDEKDEFLITITGETVYTGTMIFQITTHHGSLILKESYPAHFLLGYAFLGDPNSLKDKEEFIIKRATEFFNENNFNNPAISPEEDFDEDYSDKEIWEDIISDKTSIGFYYLIGEGDGRRIAFSKKKKRVVLYFNCC